MRERASGIQAGALAMLHLGFSKEWIDHLATFHPSLCTNSNVGTKVDGLLARGFKNPIKLITVNPTILCYTFDNIDAKIEGLNQRGFENPIKPITTFPKMFDYSFNNIDAKIEGLQERGFADPIKLITYFPSAVSYTLDNIDAKINGLQERGFADPTKLITSFPALLGYTFANIDRKIRLLYLLHGNRAKAVSEITALPSLVSYKWRRLLFAVRLSNPNGLRRLVMFNPKLLAVAKGQTGSNSPNRLRARARSLSRSLNGENIDNLIGDLVEQKCLDPRFVRALSRI